jgi:hypothetical protein
LHCLCERSFRLWHLVRRSIERRKGSVRQNRSISRVYPYEAFLDRCIGSTQAHQRSAHFRAPTAPLAAWPKRGLWRQLGGEALASGSRYSTKPIFDCNVDLPGERLAIPLFRNAQNCALISIA